MRLSCGNQTSVFLKWKIWTQIIGFLATNCIALQDLYWLTLIRPTIFMTIGAYYKAEYIFNISYNNYIYFYYIFLAHLDHQSDKIEQRITDIFGKPQTGLCN